MGLPREVRALSALGLARGVDLRSTSLAVLQTYAHFCTLMHTYAHLQCKKVTCGASRPVGTRRHLYNARA